MKDASLWQAARLIGYISGTFEATRHLIDALEVRMFGAAGEDMLGRADFWWSGRRESNPMTSLEGEDCSAALQHKRRSGGSPTAREYPS
jgi:hypothetical protein